MNIMGVRKADPGGQKSKVGGQKNKGGVKKTRAPNKNHTWEGRKVKPALVPKKFPWNKHTNNNQKDCLHRTGQGIGQSHATPVPHPHSEIRTPYCSHYLPDPTSHFEWVNLADLASRNDILQSDNQHQGPAKLFTTLRRTWKRLYHQET